MRGRPQASSGPVGSGSRRRQPTGEAVGDDALLTLALGGTDELLFLLLLALAVYGLVALVGIKKWPLLLGPAWLAHSLWAQLLHAGGHPAFVPEWCVPLCMGFDIVVGITLMATLRYKPKRAPFGFVKEPER